jgi:hypothetical protein
MPLENLNSLTELTKAENIAIRALAWGYAPLILAIIAQWVAAWKKEDKHAQQIADLIAKFEEVNNNAWSYVSKISDAVKEAATKIEKLLDRDLVDRAGRRD